MSADGTEQQDFSDLLIRVGAERSREAFGSIFNHFAPRLKTYFGKRGVPSDQAEEIVQDVMMTVWRKAEDYDAAKAAASTWIFRIARNRSIDLDRKAQRPKLDADDPIFAPQMPEMPERRLLKRQLGREVRTELADLSDAHRDLLYAAFYEGLTHQQIAQRFDMPLGTVKSRIRAAYAMLRDNLTDPNHV